MKKISIFAIVLAVLCIIMCSALVGCSSNNGAAGDKTEASQAGATDAATDAAANTETKAAEIESKAAENSETNSAAEKSPVVGTWEYDGMTGFTYTFNEDGTGKYDVLGEVMNFTYTDNGTSLDILYEDTDAPFTTEYTIDGNTLIIKDSFGADVKYVKK